VRSIPQLLHQLLHHHDSQRFLNRIDPSVGRKLGLMYTAALRSVALFAGTVDSTDIFDHSGVV
jgi:hypothetical protein